MTIQFHRLHIDHKAQPRVLVGVGSRSINRVVQLPKLGAENTRIGPNLLSQFPRVDVENGEFQPVGIGIPARTRIVFETHCGHERRALDDFLLVVRERVELILRDVDLSRVVAGALHKLGPCGCPQLTD